MNARGGFLTTRKQNNDASSRRSIDDERNFGDFGYAVTAWHEDSVKIDNGIKKELHVLKKQLRKNIKLHRQMNKCSRNRNNKEQHALMDEIVPVQVKDPS